MKKLAVGAIFAISLFRLGGRQGAREDRGCRANRAAGQDPLDETGVRDVVADRLAARALGDDRLERVRVCGGVDQHLAADREADPADPVGIDVRAALEVLDRGVEVAVADPAEDVRVAVARALAAAVEEEDAVAVLDRACARASAGRSVRGRRSRWRRSARG